MGKPPSTRDEKILSRQVEKLHYSFEEYCERNEPTSHEASKMFNDFEARAAWDYLHSTKSDGNWGVALDAILRDLTARLRNGENA